ncbi:MAG: DNA gyrase inhibitor YacG [Steroidobacteraceae bacterium]
MASKRIKCPTCGREVEWASAPFRPFCSERCRLIDLGAWLSEQRAIPGEGTAAPDGGAPDNSTQKG